jgi:hypothetical protein
MGTRPKERFANRSNSTVLYKNHSNPVSRESIARLSGDTRPRLGARRTTWPLPSRLDASAPMDWPTIVVHFLRRPSPSRRVRPFAVVPLLVTNKLPQKLVTAQRNLEVTDTRGLQR